MKKLFSLQSKIIKRTIAILLMLCMFLSLIPLVGITMETNTGESEIVAHEDKEEEPEDNAVSCEASRIDAHFPRHGGGDAGFHLKGGCSLPAGLRFQLKFPHCGLISTRGR